MVTPRLRGFLAAALVLAIAILALALTAGLGNQGTLWPTRYVPEWTVTRTTWAYPPGSPYNSPVMPTFADPYPLYPSPVPTSPPRPSRTPWPTAVPAPPPPTPWLTPVITPIPLARPPYVPAAVGKTTQPYRIFLREDNRVWVVNHDGTGRRLVIDTVQALSKYLGVGIGTEWPIDWGGPSPDGRQLALVLSNAAKPPTVTDWGAAGYGLYVVEVDSGQTRLLVKYAEAPVWSPDSQWLAYRLLGSGELWIANVVTGQTRLVFVSEEKGRWAAEFAWSPDGRRLAILEVHDFWESPSILVVDVDGKNKTVELVAMRYHYLYRPQWSPDGQKILYVSSLGTRVGPDPADNLWVMDVDGSEQRQLTEDMTVVCQHWSPDGQWIVFVATRHYENPAPYDLWLIRPDGKQLRRLGEDPAIIRAARWSPDGTQIVVEREEQGLWTLDLVSGDWQQVCSENLDFAVAW